jgi:GT2 family glycosyltransferase
MANWREGWALGLGVAAMVWKNLRPRRRLPAAPRPNGDPGVSVVIPSRQGRQLLEGMLGAVEADLGDGEIIVVDNGSTDGTAEWLRECHPRVRVEAHPQPLSFARAANRGASIARCCRLCLLNNDMEIEPGFFSVLEGAFAEDSDLFCASAQIFFPSGARREETGKTAMHRPEGLTPADYPVFCDEPLAGEDRSPVLYGSGGCSLYDRAKFLALGGFDEIYEPAYVEDLDLGYRAWRRGWPSVYVAGARVLHRHRATTARFFTGKELDRLLDRNHARFILRAIDSLEVFIPYWRHAMSRCPVISPPEIFRAASAPRWKGTRSDREILALTGGAVRVFPGRGAGGACLAWHCPRSTPPTNLINRYKVVACVDGTAGERAWRAALLEMERRYPDEEVVHL